MEGGRPQLEKGKGKLVPSDGCEVERYSLKAL